jgi:hypothetical protein
VALDDPGLDVGVLEDVERLAQVLDGVEAADPEQVFLERPDEPLGAAGQCSPEGCMILQSTSTALCVVHNPL